MASHLKECPASESVEFASFTCDCVRLIQDVFNGRRCLTPTLDEHRALFVEVKAVKAELDMLRSEIERLKQAVPLREHTFMWNTNDYGPLVPRAAKTPRKRMQEWFDVHQLDNSPITAIVLEIMNFLEGKS